MCVCVRQGNVGLWGWGTASWGEHEVLSCFKCPEDDTSGKGDLFYPNELDSDYMRNTHHPKGSHITRTLEAPPRTMECYGIGVPY